MSRPDVPPPDATPADEPTQALVARMAAGDRDALTLLYETHGARILRFLHALTGDRHLAEDLAQETFLAAWRAAPRYRPEAPVEHWLFAIARRLGWRRTKQRARKLEVLRRSAADTPTGEAPASDHRAEQREEIERLHRALTRIPPRLRLVFVLVRISGCSYAETARIARIPVGTVKSRMSAAECRLRESMAMEDDHHP